MRSKGGEGERINSYKVVDNPPQIRTSIYLMFAISIYNDRDGRCLLCGISSEAILIRMRPTFRRQKCNQFPPSAFFLFESFTLNWLSKADIKIYVDEFTISFVANFRDAMNIFA